MAVENVIQTEKMCGSIFSWNVEFYICFWMSSVLKLKEAPVQLVKNFAQIEFDVEKRIYTFRQHKFKYF